LLFAQGRTGRSGIEARVCAKREAINATCNFLSMDWSRRMYARRLSQAAKRNALQMRYEIDPLFRHVMHKRRRLSHELAAG